MKKELFISSLREELEIEKELKLTTNLKDLEEWDSMTAMVLIGFVLDNFEVTLVSDDLEKMDDINSLINIIGVNKFI